MSDTNLKTPIVITVANVSDIAVGMVPYRECFAKKLPAHSSLTFTASTAEQVLYYKKQGDKRLTVAAHGTDEAFMIGGSCSSAGVFTAGAPFAISQDGTSFVINGFIPYREADSFSPAGPAFVVKLKNPSIANRGALPSGTICKTTNDKVPGGIAEYTKAAFEDDGSLVIVGETNYNRWASKKVMEVQVAWTESNSELVWTTYTIVVGNATFGKEGEEAPEIVDTTITYPQNVTFTNSSDHKISIMPYKQNVAIAVGANDSLTISISKPELVMYYLEQGENNLVITL